LLEEVFSLAQHSLLVVVFLVCHLMPTSQR